jgi:hypothetical protein
MQGDRRWGLDDVMGELTRKPGHIPHVQEPRQPQLLHGVPVENFSAGVRRDVLRCRDLAGRRLRSDAVVAGMGVASFPHSCEQVRSDPALAAMQAQWLHLNIQFGQREWEARLAFVILHADETYPNLHFGLRADVQDDVTRDGAPRHRLAVESICPMRAAARAVIDAGGSAAEAGAAARAAGSALQLRYSEGVGQPLGFARPGAAGAERLSRTG